MSQKRSENIPLVDLVAAIKLVLVEKRSQRQVSRDFGVPRSSLQRYVDHIKRSIPDVTAATDEELMGILDSSTTKGPIAVCFHFFPFLFCLH